MKLTLQTNHTPMRGLTLRSVLLALVMLLLFTTRTSAQMSEAYRLANAMVREKLMKENPENIRILDDLKKNDVIVVTGAYDDMATVLENLGIPFAAVSQRQLITATLDPHQTIFVNCDGSFLAEAAHKLADFVAKGGQLITTDWAMELIEAGFPNTIAFNDKPTADDVVRIEAVDRHDSAIAGFFDEKADPVWWLEASSFPINILDKKNVKVLIRSKELGEKYGADPVVIRFTHGKGVVYHMISHFYLQRTEARDKKQSTMASDYFKDKGACAANVAKASATRVTYGEMQAASTSTDFVSRIIIGQKKKAKTQG